MELMSGKTQNDPDEHHRFIMMMAAFLHDIGKAHSKLGVKHNDLVFNGKNFSENIPKVSDHDIVGAPIAYEFCKSLGMTNDDCEFVRAMTENHMRMHQLVQMKSPAKIWQFIKNTPFDDLIVLAECDENGCIKASNDEWDGILRSLEREVQVFTSGSSVKVKIDELRKMDLPKPVLTGYDLIQFGKKPGPVFKKILQKAFEFQIDNGVSEKERLYNLTKGIQLKVDEK
jgi:CRISPR/Cas system-associated endonuclease Cas3-HD